ncbi:MAG: cytochrome b [Gammaproteobacteria bacterium]|nr:MAG: cytochrome b [Gammaproteobacteria bacterium]
MTDVPRSADRYDRVQIILHWLIGFILITMIGLGLFMVELPKQSELPAGEESVRAFYFLLHKSIGITVLFLIVIRILWRLTHKAPPMPASINKWQQRAAGAMHWILYGFMLALPFSGFAQSMFSKYSTKFWGYPLPRLMEADSAMRAIYTDLHQALAYVFIGLIAIHILAAVKHYFAKTGIVERMSLR